MGRRAVPGRGRRRAGRLPVRVRDPVAGADAGEDGPPDPGRGRRRRADQVPAGARARARRLHRVLDALRCARPDHLVLQPARQAPGRPVRRDDRHPGADPVRPPRPRRGHAPAARLVGAVAGDLHAPGRAGDDGPPVPGAVLGAAAGGAGLPGAAHSRAGRRRDQPSAAAGHPPGDPAVRRARGAPPAGDCRCSR